MMEVTKRDIEWRMARFNEACRKSGAKLTHQRMEVFREVAQTGDHPDVEKVYQGVCERMPTISLPDTLVAQGTWIDYNTRASPRANPF